MGVDDVLSRVDAGDLAIVSAPSHPLRLRNVAADRSLSAQTLPKFESARGRTVTRRFALGAVSKPMGASRGEGIGVVRQVKLADQVAAFWASKPPTPAAKRLGSC